jgi:hypothetical protein
VNLRAIGCIVIGSLVFIGIGLFGLSLAVTRMGCPDYLQWAEVGYRPDRAATSSPTISDVAGEHPVEIGTTFIGLTTRKVYGPMGTDPSNPEAERPAQIVLECGDGTYQTYLSESAQGS